MKNALAPVCLFTYKRLEETRLTLEALKANRLAEQTALYIFSDGPRKAQDEADIQKVRELIEKVEGFASVELVLKEKNTGLARSIIGGVSQVLAQHKRVIVLEDDIKTSPNFLEYMNQGLDFYESNPQVHSIAGYIFPLKTPQNYPYDVFFTPRSSSWGWASWIDRWEDVDWEVKTYESFRNNSKQVQAFNQGGSDLSGMLQKQMEGKIDSWAIRWAYHQFRTQQLTAYPCLSKVENIGFSQAASNTRFYNRFATTLDSGEQKTFKFPEEVKLDPQFMRPFKDKYSLRARATGRLKYYLGFR